MVEAIAEVAREEDGDGGDGTGGGTVEEGLRAEISGRALARNLAGSVSVSGGGRRVIYFCGSESEADNQLGKEVGYTSCLLCQRNQQISEGLSCSPLGMSQKKAKNTNAFPKSAELLKIIFDHYPSLWIDESFLIDVLA